MSPMWPVRDGTGGRLSTQGIGFLVIIAQSGGRLEEFPRRVQMNHVPRVGEYIEVGRDLGIAQGKHHFATVQSVIYQLHGEQLVPLVTAALGTDRENILAERLAGNRCRPRLSKSLAR